jgi:hypothetical protein
LEGVSIVKAAQGYLKCQNCGALLRVTSYGKHFWFFFTPPVVLAILWALFPGLTIVWIPFLFVITISFGGLWKFALLVKVDTGEQPSTNPVS